MGISQLNQVSRMYLRVVLIFSLCICLSQAIFGGPSSPQSSCRADHECPGLRYSRGRCVQKRDGWCGFQNIFAGNNKANCRYQRCARCVVDGDCDYDQHCTRSFSCRSIPTTMIMIMILTGEHGLAMISIVTTEEDSEDRTIR